MAIKFLNSVNADSGVLYVDAANDRVGIGTTSPGARLNVKSTGSTADQITLTHSGNTVNVVAIGQESSHGSLVLRANSGVNKVRLSAAGNSSYILESNVGIGTTSPGASLHVASTTNDYVAKFSHTTATGYAPGSILLQAGQAVSRGQGLYHYNTEANESWFTGVPYNVSSNKWIVANKPDTTFNPDVAQLSHALLTIQDSGQVGIGTTSPARELHVKGNNGWGEVRIEGQTFASGHGASLEFYSEGTALADIYASTDKHLYFRTNGGTERMRITSAGRVGIGTTNPAYHIHGLSAESGWGYSFQNATADEDVNVYMSHGGGYGIAVDSTENASDKYLLKLSGGTGGGAGIGSVTRMIVTAAGNVGIGTTSPREKLDVDGDIVTTWGNDRFVGLQYQQGAAYQNGLLLHGDNRSTGLIAKGGTGSTPYIWFGVSEGGNTERMRITKDGNVGIGTTAPEKKLHIIGTSSDTAGAGLFAIEGDAGNVSWVFRSTDTGDNLAIDREYGGAGSYYNTLTLQRSTGNVGIGTTAPGYKLDVSGDFRVKDGSSAIAFNEYSDGATIWLDGSNGDFAGGDYFNISAYGTTDLAFGYGASTKITMKSDGKLGIGTTSPGANLQVYSTSNRDVFISGYGTQAQNTWQAQHAFFTSAGQGVIVGKANVGNDANRLHILYNTSNGDAQYLGYDTSNNNKVKLNTNGNSYLNGGNVGIGTTSPTQKLHVAGSQVRLDTAGGGYYLHNTSGTFRGAFHDNGTVTSIYADGNGSTAAISIESGNSTFAGDVSLVDDKILKIGTGNDLTLKHNATDSFIENQTGNLNIVNYADDKDIIFWGDDGSGGIATYFKLDGANEANLFSKNVKLSDNVELRIGSGNDLKIYHDGSNSYINDTGTGDLIIKGGNDIIFKDAVDNLLVNMNQSNSVELYYGGSKKFETTSTGVTITGGWVTDGVSVATANVEHTDNTKSLFGNGNDLQIYHNATDSVIENSTGDLYFTNKADDKDIVFRTDDGSGGYATYFYLDGSGAITRVSRNFRADDSVALQVGSNGDAGFFHDGTNTSISNDTGDLIIQNNANDKDIVFKSDDGSGGTTTYFYLDGGSADGTNLYTKFPDSSRLLFGTGEDLQIYHDGSNSYIREVGTGDLYIRANNLRLQNADGSGQTINTNNGGNVELFYNNSKKFETTSTGVTVTGNLVASNDITASGDLSVRNITASGNLIVNGTTTTLNTQTVEVEDNILQLNTTQGTPDTATAATSGISVYRGDGVTQASLIFDDADDTWDLTNNLTVAGQITSAQNQITTNIGSTSAIRLKPAATTDTTGKSSIFLGTSIVDNYGISLRGARLGNNGQPTFEIATHLNSANGTVALSIDNSQNATFAGNVAMASGNATGKFAVKSAGVHASYDFYNDGTSYFNGAVTVDAGLSQTGGADATFSGIVGVGSTGVYAGTNAALNLPGKGIALKNDKDGSNNNWSYINNTATAGSSNINFATGQASSALTLAHNGNATFAGSIYANTIYSATNSAYYIDVNSTGVGLNTAGGATFAGDVAIQKTADVYLTLESTDTTTAEEVAVKYSNQSTGSNYWWAGLNQSANYSLAYGTAYSGANVKMEISTAGNATFAGDITSTGLTVDYTGNRTGDAGILVTNDGSDWGVKVDKDGTTDYGILSQTDGDNAIVVRNAAGTTNIQLQGDGDATFAGDVTAGALTSGATAQLVVNHEGGASAVAKFMSRTNRAFVQIGDNDTNGYLVAEGTNFAIGRVATVAGNSIVIDANHNATFASEVTSTDDINALTKIVVGENATAEVRIKKTNAGSGKLSFYNNDGTSSTQQGYLSLDANEDFVMYSAANNENHFYAGGVLNSTQIGANTNFAGDITQADGKRIWFRDSSASSGTGAQSYVFSDGLNLKIKGDDNVQILGDGGGIIAHFDYTSKVGIGTTVPKSMLHVAGGIQMSNDTAAASADKVGTMRYRTDTEYVEVNGTNIITNGDFAADSNWTKVGDVAIASGVATFDDGGSNTNSYLQQDALTATKKYLITLDVKRYVAGRIQILAGTDVYSVNISQGVGSYSIYTGAVGSAVLRIKRDGSYANFDFDIDNVSAIEVTAEDASYADMCMQTGASTYEWVNIVRNTY